MALSKTHTLAFLIGLNRKGKRHLFEQMLPGVLLPDAIRCYGLSRIVTHFEKHYITGEASGIEFPAISKLKTLDKDKVANLRIVNAENLSGEKLDYEQVAIGDETSLTAFKMMNSHLPNLDFKSIQIHLIQDSVYDEYIRQVIDCSLRRYPGNIFKFEGKVFDAKQVRQLISEIEEQEFRFMCDIYERENGEKINQEWFDNNVRTVIESAYCPQMAEKTLGFIKIDNDSPKPCHLPDYKVSGIVSALISCSENAIEAV